MAFSFAGILAVVLEFFRPFLWLIALVALADLVVLALALRGGAVGARFRVARTPALIAGLTALIVAALVLPGMTQAGFSDLYGVLDWAALLGASLAVGVAAALLLLPPLMLLRR